VTARGWTPETAAAAFERVRAERADLAHDPYALRVEALRAVLAEAGEDPALADRAVDVVDEARQVVELHPEVPEALDRLASRFPLLAVTNGTADLEKTGVARWFEGNVAAPAVGVAKPEPRIFALACERLGLPPGEVLHAGDHLVMDVQGALDAGMQAAWVHRDLEGEAPEGALRCLDLTALADALCG
jgi:FMN hydrolase / 5-amino-6-(5-phospho-D-ribitylamino)uracil phosphatase